MGEERIDRPLPIGVDDFRELREGGYYYVDKSELISDILRERSRVYLFTRPRRFGKSLNLSMIDSFFNSDYKGNTWFEGLRVLEDDGCLAHMNSYPVIRISMKDLTTSSFDVFLDDLKETVAMIYGRFQYLKGYADLNEELRSGYLSGSVRDFNRSQLSRSIAALCEMLEQYHGVRPIVLIDEYDNAINNAFGKDSYGSIMEFLRNFYSSILKGSPCITFAVVTGVLQISKESIFSGLNNLKINNIFTEKSDERYGFTSDEVKDLCSYYGHSEKYSEAREWYDGYRFGNAEIFNPWSILNYVGDGFKSGEHWAGTSGNEIIDTLLDNADDTLFKEMQALAEKRPVVSRLCPSVTMYDLKNDVRSNIYSIMAVSGYLKAIPMDEGYGLTIPNREMYAVFERMFTKRLHYRACSVYDDFFNGMERADIALMEKGLDSILQDNIPFILLTAEKDYQFIIAVSAMCRGGRYSVKMEEEAGNGRADIVLTPNVPDVPTIVFELKRSRTKNPETLKKYADAAIGQIKDRGYFNRIRGRILLYGICFYRKVSAISFEELYR